MSRMLILAASVVLASAAHANPAEIVITKGPAAIINYADLDLNSAVGRQSLVGRIHFAADAMCLENNVEPLAVKIERMRCYRVAVENGAAAMNHIGR